MGGDEERDRARRSLPGESPLDRGRRVPRKDGAEAPVAEDENERGRVRLGAGAFSRMKDVERDPSAEEEPAPPPSRRPIGAGSDRSLLEEGVERVGGGEPVVDDASRRLL
jgi:hypothetical protein